MNKEIKPGYDYVGVGGGVLILNEKNQCLLMKRSGEVRNESGWWSKPGGLVRFNEKSVDAMRREIKEELGIEIKIIGQLPHTDHIIKKEKHHWLAVNYIAKIKSGKPKIMEPHKCTELKWFNLNKLPEKITQTTKEPIADYLAGRCIEIKKLT